MLLKCPECQRDVSDKALTCLHCSYAMNTPSNREPRIRNGKPTKLLNGYCTIYRMSGRRSRRVKAISRLYKRSLVFPWISSALLFSFALFFARVILNLFQTASPYCLQSSSYPKLGCLLFILIISRKGAKQPLFITS